MTVNPQVDGGGDNNVYVADDDNHRVTKFKSDGTYISQVGGYGTGNGQFEFPYDVGVDSQGFLYVADNNNHRVQKFDAATLGFLASWGGFGPAPGQFEYPRALAGLAEDPQGGTYVADNANNRIQGLDPNGNVTASWGIAGRGPGYVTRPNGVAVDAAGKVYVADTYDNRLELLGSNGAYLGQIGNISTASGFAAPGTSKGSLDLPSGVAISPKDGSVWVTETGNERVQQFSPAGAAVATYGGPDAGNAAGQFHNPDALAIDQLGNVFVADTDNNRVQWRNFKTGAWNVMAFKDVSFDDPAAIAVYKADLYVGERNRVLRIRQGRATALTPPGPAFNQPGGLWADNGDLYISDTRNDRVLRLDTKGNWTTVGTEGLAVGSFNLPGGLAMSRDGANLYVADTFNDRIQAFSFPGRDIVAPALKATAASKQKMRRQRWAINVKATTNEKSALRITGSIKVGGVKRPLSLRATKATLQPNRSRTLKVKLNKAQRRTLTKAFAHRKKATATLQISATDGSKNSKALTRRVKLVR